MASKRKSTFTNAELCVLKEAFDLACADLKLAPDRHYLRSYLGVLMFEIASEGESEMSELRIRSVRRFRRGHEPDARVPETVTLPWLGGRRVRYLAGFRVHQT